MNRIVLSLGLFMALVLPSVFAGDIDPYESSDPVDAAFENAGLAFSSDSLKDIHEFSRQTMAAMSRLQAQAIADGDETLANLAQAAYNNAMRASMAESMSEARAYSMQAMASVEETKNFLGRAAEENENFASRWNPNVDPDRALEVIDRHRSVDDEWDRALEVYQRSNQDPAAN